MKCNHGLHHKWDKAQVGDWDARRLPIPNSQPAVTIKVEGQISIVLERGDLQEMLRALGEAEH